MSNEVTSITAGIKTWLSGFYGLSGGRINVDCLPSSLSAYSLYSLDSEPTFEVTKYHGGGSTVRRIFILSSREPWGEDIQNNIDILNWYDNFSAWLRKCNRQRRFPDIGPDRQVTGVDVISSGYPITMDDRGSARYQVTFKITYEEE